LNWNRVGAGNAAVMTWGFLVALLRIQTLSRYGQLAALTEI
jgi:hypothetical protein